jgi:hypothetical protein
MILFLQMEREGWCPIFGWGYYAPVLAAHVLRKALDRIQVALVVKIPI